MKDGDSFAIGGLSQDDVINTHSKVALIGQVFRKDSKTQSKTELYILVRPHIVRRSMLRAGEIASKPVYAPTTTTIINAQKSSPAASLIGTGADKSAPCPRSSRTPQSRSRLD